jgi:hypothetical protein
MHATSRFIAIGFAAASFLLIPVANAQTQPASPPSSTTAPDATAPDARAKAADLSDKKLDAAAKAVKQVSAVSDTYKKKLAATPDKAEKERLLDQADKDVTKAVTDQGLSVDEYMAIMKVAENDSTVRTKLIDRLK